MADDLDWLNDNDSGDEMNEAELSSNHLNNTLYKMGFKDGKKEETDKLNQDYYNKVFQKALYDEFHNAKLLGYITATAPKNSQIALEKDEILELMRNEDDDNPNHYREIVNRMNQLKQKVQIDHDTETRIEISKNLYLKKTIRYSTIELL